MMLILVVWKPETFRPPVPSEVFSGHHNHGSFFGGTGTVVSEHH